MSEFSLSTFLRMIPNYLLHDYFEHRSIPLSVDPRDFGEHTIEPVLKAIEVLEPAARNQVDVDFQDIFAIANKDGSTVLHEEDERRGLELKETLDDLPSYQARAMWVFLYPDHGGVNLFELCSHYTQVDRLTRHQARRRKHLPRMVPLFDERTLQEMEDRLRRFYRPQGRGYHCRIEYHYRAHAPRHCYCAYPEDHAAAELIYEGGDLQPRQRRPAFELVFLYDEEEGTLDLAGEGIGGDIHLLHEIFCLTALGMTSAPEATREKCYSLGGLLGTFSFPTDPSDGIETVEVIQLSLHPRGQPNRSIIAQVNEGPMEEWLAQSLALDRIPLALWEVTAAKLRVTFAGQDGKAGKKVVFTISTPDRCSLKDHPHDRLIQGYLRRWNLML